MEINLFPNDLQPNESLILYKLIVLYMLDTIETPLSNSRISEFILSCGLASYFTIQQTVSELQDSGLIHGEKLRHSTCYTITDNGVSTLLYYKKLLPPDIKDTVNKYAKENKLEIKQQLSLYAAYEPAKEKDFNVHCIIKERERTIFELMVNAPTKELAETMCQQWERKNEELYTHIMKELLNTKPEEDD